MLKMNRTVLGTEQNVANFIAYLFGWMSGVIVLLVEKQNEDVRFHAAQSVVIFGSLNLFGFLGSVLPVLGSVLQPLVVIFAFGLWIVLMLTSLMECAPRLPVVNGVAQKLDRGSRELADRSWTWSR